MALDDFMELNPLALGLALAGSAIFIVMIWKIPTWDTFSFKNKIIISVALPIVSYFIVNYQLNR